MFYLIKQQGAGNINKYPFRIAQCKNKNQIQRENIFFIFAKHPDEKLDSQEYPDAMLGKKEMYFMYPTVLLSICFVEIEE